MTRFGYFGKILQVFGQFLKLKLLHGKILNLLWQIVKLSRHLVTLVDGTTYLNLQLFRLAQLTLVAFDAAA